MDRPRAPGVLACPPTREAPGAAAFPGFEPEREPRIDERLAPPETRVEFLHGMELFAAPADPPHATKHSQVDRVIGSHVAEGYIPAVDMLTRTAGASDFAPDVSVFPAEPDPETKGRRLEELAFEVASEQALSVPTEKARELIRRGVRRVFCVLVKQRRVLEWSRETDGWATLPESAVIDDRCLVRPLPVAALLDAALADDAVVQALLVKRPPSLVRALEAQLAEGHKEGHREGHKEGHREGHKEGELEARRQDLLLVLSERGILVPEDVRAAIAGCADLARLERWFRRAITARTAAEVLD